MAEKGKLIYGFNPVMEALRVGAASRVYVAGGRRERLSDILGEARRRGAEVETVPESFFDRFPKGHQSIAARVREKAEAGLEDMLEAARREGEAPFLVALDGIEDPRNLGAIIRTAHEAGVHGIVVQRHRQAEMGPEVFKTSAGAAWHMPVSVHSNIKYAIDELKEKGLLIVGAEAGGRLAPWEMDLSVPVVLVLGGEDAGIRKVVKERCDRILSLPLRGFTGSLNVSVAAGVFIFEILRQRTRKKAE
jgi:23S rRNA (guanosine2251-2'-O)-methyltransferase